MAYRDTDICRKRNAFRDRIRKDYIQGMFKQRRAQFTQLQQQQQQKAKHIKQLNQFTVNSANKNNINENQYPFHSQQIPNLSLYDNSWAITQQINNNNSNNGNGNRREVMNIAKFQNYQQFSQYLEHLFKLLPKSSSGLVLLLNNNTRLIAQFMKYLFSEDECNNSQTGLYGSPAKKLQFQSSNTGNRNIYNNENNNKSYSEHKQYRNLQYFINKFIQCSVSQYLNYLHILQTLLIHLPYYSQNRTIIIKSTSTRICGKIASLLKSNKIFRTQILKAYFQYLITLGDDIRMLTNVEILTAADFVKDVFGIYYNTQYNNNQQHQQGSNNNNNMRERYQSELSLQCTAITASNNILAIRAQSSQKEKHQHQNNSKFNKIDTIYKVAQIKQYFIVQLLRSKNAIHNIIDCTMLSASQFHLQHYLQFLVNLTYLLKSPSQLHLFIQHLSLMFQCVLAQHLVLGGFSIINTLLLRVINNVIVNDRVSAQTVWKQGVIHKIIKIYAGWLIKGKGQQYSDEKVLDQPTPQVYIQFISTITTYVILLFSPDKEQYQQQHNNTNNNKLSQPVRQINFTQNLDTLLTQTNITILLLQSLKLDYVSGRNNHNNSIDQQQQVSKIFQALIALHNYQQQRNQNNNNNNNSISQDRSVAGKLVQYRDVIQDIVQRYANQGENIGNVGMLGEALLEIVKIQIDKQQLRHIELQKYNKQKQMYQQMWQQRQRQQLLNNTHNQNNK